MQIIKPIVQFLKNDEAATAVEYAVMLAAILMAVIVAIAAVGQRTGDMYDDIKTGMEST